MQTNSTVLVGLIHASRTQSVEYYVCPFAFLKKAETI